MQSSVVVLDAVKVNAATFHLDFISRPLEKKKKNIMPLGTVLS
jgi:hypothetical protein